MKKKSNWKKLLSLGLVMVLTFSMAACGDKQNGGGSDSKNGNGKEKNANASLAKEYVYRGKDVDFQTNGEDTNVAAFRRNGDEIEILTVSYNYEENGSNQTITLHKMKHDGTVTDNIEMELPQNNNGQGEDQEGNAALESGETVSGGEMSITEKSVMIPMPIDGEGDADADTDYNPEEYYYENVNYGISALSEKYVFALQNKYKDGYVNGEYISEQSNSICCWDKNGKLQWVTPVDMTEYQNDEHYSYITSAVALSDDSLGIILSGDQSGMIKIGADGSVSKLKKFSSDRDVFSSEPSISVKDDGTLLISYYNDDWTKQYITSYDPSKDSFGTEYEIPAAARNQGFYNFCAGVKYDVIFANSDGLFGFNLGETEIHKVMDYVNSDLATDGLNNMVFLDENSFVASYSDPVNYQNVFAVFTYVKPEDIQEKNTILMAGVYIDMDEKANVIRFNKTNDNYRIVVTDYSIYNTEEDYTQSYTKLNNDIIAGNIPDILVLDNGMPIDSFIAKGIFANIDDLIKNDEELSKLEFMDNAFEAFRVDGALYRVIPRFTVNTWLAKKSLVGDRTSWTMDDVKQAATKLTGEKTIFGTEHGGSTREMFMNQVMEFCGRDFVDVNTGKCNFDNKLFADLLEYAKTLPSEEENQSQDDEYWEEYWEKYYTQYRENRVLMMPREIGDLNEMKYQMKGMIGEAVSFVGFPTESGSGSFIRANISYAIADKSANKDGAWQFLRFFLTEDYQRNDNYTYGYSYGMPVLKSIVRESANKLMERPYWEDENGNKNYYDDTFYMNGESIILDPFTQAEADQLFDFICSVNKAGFFDENVTKIVNEEAGSFFSGSKSAKDVAAMIQNRVQLYVNENR